VLNLSSAFPRRDLSSFPRASPAAPLAPSDKSAMAAVSAPTPKLDRYIVIHVATTCDEHGVYVTKDSAEVIELGWILLDSKTCEEVRPPNASTQHTHSRLGQNSKADTLSYLFSCTVKAFSSNQSTLRSPHFAVSSPWTNHRMYWVLLGLVADNR
jgi:hypothetical protein